MELSSEVEALDLQHTLNDLQWVGSFSQRCEGKQVALRHPEPAAGILEELDVLVLEHDDLAAVHLFDNAGADCVDQCAQHRAARVAFTRLRWSTTHEAALMQLV